MGSAREFIFMWHGLGKIHFRVTEHGKSCTESTEAITRNSNLIESSSIRWNYEDKSSFDL